MSAAKQRGREATRQKQRKKKSSSSPISSADSTELLRALKGIFNELNKVQDVLNVCAEASSASKAAQNEEIANVLRRCGVDPLFTELQLLSRFIEGLGGETCLTGDAGDDQ